VEYRLANVGIVLATILVLGVIAAKIASTRITYKLLKGA
jgi:lipoprotein-releasing system permease protein